MGARPIYLSIRAIADIFYQYNKYKQINIIELHSKNTNPGGLIRVEMPHAAGSHFRGLQIYSLSPRDAIPPFIRPAVA